MSRLLDSPILLFFVIFLGLGLAVEIGFRRALMLGTRMDDKRHDQIVDTRNQIVLLLSLLLGFTLAMALPRYDQRRQLVVDEASAIGTASLRTQVLPEPARTETQQLLRQYAQARLEFGQAGLNQEVFQNALHEGKELQTQLWQEATAAAQQTPTPITALFVAAVNDAIDLDEKRLSAYENRIPTVIWAMLGVLGLLTCLTVGYGQQQRFLVSMIVPPLMIAIVMALIADLDAPRSGLIPINQQSMQRLQRDLDSSAPAK